MRTIAVICPGLPERTPSTHYRFGQYRDLWREEGCELIFLPKQELVAEDAALGSLAAHALKVLEKADVIVNQKCLLSSRLFTQIKALGKPLFFDFDDLIWHRAGNDYSFLTRLKINRRLLLWSQGVDQVICANSYLQSALLKKTGVASLVVPMSLDLDLWFPRADRGSLEQIKKDSDLPVGSVQVGWTGSPEYHWLLRKLEPALIQAQQQERRLKFSIHSGVDPQLNFDYLFVPWQKGNEPEYVRSLDIGLLPMDENSLFSLGKSPIKGLQYLASGVVPLGNFCGATLDYLNASNSFMIENDWGDRLIQVARQGGSILGKRASGASFVKFNHDALHVGIILLSALQKYS